MIIGRNEGGTTVGSVWVGAGRADPPPGSDWRLAGSDHEVRQDLTDGSGRRRA